MRSLTFLENLALGKEMLLKYRDVYNFPFLSPEEISEYQFKKVKALIHIAYKHTGFYKQLYKNVGVYPEDIKTWDDFEKLPTITKEDIIKNFKDCIVDTRRNDPNLILSRSSGSSGKFINILFENKSWYEQALITLRMYQQSFEFKPFDKIALIYPSEFPFSSILGLYKAEYLYSLSPSEEIIEKLKVLRPAIISAYPSILFELVTKFEKECKNLKPKAITTNSEQTTQNQRDFISSVFGCPVYDEYSTEELTLVGFQCKKLNYHLQEDCTYIEILDPYKNQQMPQNKLGEIVGTCLVNNVMPFIRYRHGDLGKVRRSDCACGKHSRILSDISGRMNSSFLLSNGTIVPSGKILDWTYTLVLQHNIPLKQFQVVQKTKTNINIIIVPKESYRSEKHDPIIRRSFLKEFGTDLKIDITKTSFIPKTPAGKHIPIKSLVENHKFVAGRSFHTKSNNPLEFI